MDRSPLQFAGIKWLLCAALFLFPPALQASFIESSIGAAVVNDATASYYNPAALTLLKQSQIVAQGSTANQVTEFTGEATQSSTNFVQSGSSQTQAKFYLPSMYLGIPASDRVIFGLAMVSNFFNSSLDDNSILRYAKSNNGIDNYEVTPAISIKLNNFISIGGALSFSYAKSILEPISGFPSLNIPDSQSLNESSARGWGGDAGVLFTLSPTTLLGVNYRSAVTYQFSGSSTIEGSPSFTSNDYNYTIWTPARGVLTISQFITPKLSFITTVQRIQWSVFDEVHVEGIASSQGPQKGDIPFHYRDTWLLTVGSQYRLSQKWVIRAASSYNQSPGNSQCQIVNGDGIIVGASTGYKISKHFIVDGSYAHEFVKNEAINISGERNDIQGVNKNYRNSVSLKLTVDL